MTVHDLDKSDAYHEKRRELEGNIRTIEQSVRRLRDALQLRKEELYHYNQENCQHLHTDGNNALKVVMERRQCPYCLRLFPLQG